MDIIKCKICFNQYDELKHRPRTLGCGHYFCEECIDNVISSGTPNCPVCQQIITVKKASEAIVNYALEELLQNVKTTDDYSTPSKEQVSMPLPDFCPKHCSCRLNFVCMTHNVKVCRDCTVIDHKSDKCNVISFQDEIELKKKNTLDSMKSLFHSLKDAQHSLESHFESKDCEVVALKSKIELLQQQIQNHQQTIENIKKSQVSTKQILSKVKITQEEIQKSMSNLQQMNLSELMTSLEDHIKQNDDTYFWEENFRKELNLMSTFYISTIIRKFTAGVYATENAGKFERYARIVEDKGKAHILSLRQRIPPGEAYKLPLSSLEMLYSNVNPEVFINISNNGSLLGTIYIKVVHSEHGRYFKNVCCGTYGSSYRGVQLSLVTQERSPNHNHGTSSIFNHNQRPMTSPAPQGFRFSFGSIGPRPMVSPSQPVQQSAARSLGCSHHIHEDGTVNTTLLPQSSVTNEEKESMKIGKVYAFGNGGFIISHRNSPEQGIPIGEVTQGMEVAQAAMNPHPHAQNRSPLFINSHAIITSQKVEISEVGMVLFHQK